MSIPKGWLIRMKQYLRRPYEWFDEYEKEFRTLKTSATQSTAFGRFDRIEIVPVDCFTEFRSISANDKNWFGKRQSIILYGLSDVKRKFYVPKELDSVDVPPLVTMDPQKATLDCRFLVLTMLHISGVVKSQIKNYKKFLEVISNEIDCIVVAYSKQKQNQKEILNCEVFGTFNSAEIAVLWAADQFVDVLFLLDQLRHMKFNYFDQGGNEIDETIFVSTYTVISGNPTFSNKHADEPKGSAMIQLECSPTGESFDATTEFIHGCLKQAIESYNHDSTYHQKELQVSSYPLFSSTGEYDYTVSIPFSLVHYLFPYSQSSDLNFTFSFHNPEFARYIRQTTTCLSYAISDIEDLSEEFDWESILTISENDLMLISPPVKLLPFNAIEYLSADKGKTYELYCKVRDALKANMPYSPIWKTLELLYSDYATILCTAVDYLWVIDFSEQFQSSLIIINSYIEWYQNMVETKREKQNVPFPEIIESLCDTLLQQINHISESSKLFFEVPNSKLGYTAQFDLILHAYYGLVKGLISQAYSVEHDSWQYTLIPVINFVNTVKIRSNMYCTPDGDLKTPRLISIALPYDSWANPLYYLPFLVHEVFHYVAPPNRSIRNETFVTIILHRICLDWVKRSAIYLWATENRISPSDVDGNRLLELYNATAQKIVIAFSEPLLSTIKESTSEFFLDSDVQLTGDELRDHLAFWISNQQSNLGEIEWVHNFIQSCLDELQRKDLEPEVRHYIEKFANGDFSFEKDRAFCSDCYTAFHNASVGLMHVLRELYPDLAMVDVCSMNLVDYLVQFASLQTNILNRPSDINIEYISFRVGFIIEYYLNQSASEMDLKDILSEFKSEFLLFLKCSGISGELEISLDATQLANEWNKFFSKLFNYFNENYSIYYYDLDKALSSNSTDSALESLSIKKVYGNYWELLHSAAPKSNIEKNIFDYNIELIHLLQRQDSLKTLSGSLEKTRDKNLSELNSINSLSHGSRICNSCLQMVSTSYHLEDPDDLFLMLRRMIHRLEKSHEILLGEPFQPGEIWYRGVIDSTFHLLPSLLVQFSKGKWAQKDGGVKKTPYEVLLHNLQQFKFRSDGASEIFNEGHFQGSDYLALMQHYGMPTTLLDWSEDIFASLYFALEHYMNSGKDSNDELDKVNAALYLFDPRAYNLIRRSIIEGNIYNWRLPRCKTTPDFVSSVYRTINKDLDLVPNVSVSVNKDIFEFMFLEKPMDFPFTPFCYKSEELHDNSILNCSPLCLHLPIAAYTSRLNPRIRAQSGQFLVFQPYTIPILESGQIAKSSFDYVALDEIQKAWLKQDPQNAPFLLTLEIDNSIKKELGNQLCKFGINTMNYYPELHNAIHSFMY